MLEVSISTTLANRDLAIVRSILNIKSQYNDLQFNYTDDSINCDVLIIKEHLDNDLIYYGLNKFSGKKHSILPTMTPKAFKDLLTILSQEITALIPQTKTEEQFDSFEKTWLHIQQETAKDQLLIDKKRLHQVVFSRSNNRVYSALKTKDQLKHVLKSNRWTSFDHHAHSHPVEHNSQWSLDKFLWDYGYDFEGKVYSHQKPESGALFKLVSWPNYGKFKFDKDFIALTALTWKKSETYASFLQSSGCDRQTIDKFLNASILSGYLLKLENDNTNEKAPKKKQNSFIRGLKRLFDFN